MTSTRQPGTSSPATPADSLTSTDTARMPSGTSACSPPAEPSGDEQPFEHHLPRDDGAGHGPPDELLRIGERGLGDRACGHLLDRQVRASRTLPGRGRPWRRRLAPTFDVSDLVERVAVEQVLADLGRDEAQAHGNQQRDGSLRFHSNHLNNDSMTTTAARPSMPACAPSQNSFLPHGGGTDHLGDCSPIRLQRADADVPQSQFTATVMLSPVEASATRSGSCRRRRR